MNRNSARILLLSAGVFWGFGFVVNKYILNNGWDDSQLLFFRFFSALVFMFLINWRRIFKANKETIIEGLKLGFVLFAGFFFQTWGLEETTASNNALITAGYIVFLPIIVLIFDKRLVKGKTITAAIVTFLGIVIISVDFNNFGAFNQGDILTFIGALFWGFHIFLQGKHAKDKDPIALMAYQLLVVSILAFIAMMIRSNLPTIDFGNWDSLKVLIVVIVIGFFASFLGFTFQLIGQKYTNETETAILISTESLFGPILGILIYSDPFNTQILIGIVLVLLGIVLSEIDVLEYIRRKRKKDKATH